MNSVKSVVAHRLCQGCGACAYACGSGAIELRNVLDIGIRPMINASKCMGCGDCVKVCSGIGLAHDRPHWPRRVIQDLAGEWGPVLEIWEGHAGDDGMWFKGGSGGVASALAAYCIEQAGMHGVLHVRMDPQHPWLNQTVMSRTRDELLAGAGSRYAPAAVCAELGEIETAPGICVLIGKPCDIAAARKAAEIRPELKARLGVTISLFCGGTPSTQGTLEMLQQLGVEPEDISDLRYRGHGWPGMAGVGMKGEPDGRRREMPYRTAWDTILTRRKPFRCHICAESTGEFADVACGDPWYRPIQEGERGSTLVLVRTERGREILRRAIEAGYVTAERRTADTLPRSQHGLLMRRRHVLPKVLTLRLMGLPYPRFYGLSLWRSWLKLGLGRKFVSFYHALRVSVSFRRRGPLRLASDGRVVSAGEVQRVEA